MPNKIQIRRSTANGTVTGLANGELAYTSNGEVLFIGAPNGNGTSVAIGGLRNPGVLTANQALVVNSTSSIDKIIVANLQPSYIYANSTSGSAGQYLTSNSTGGVYWSSPSAGVAGSNTQVQFNDSGVLAGDAGFTFDKTTDSLGIGNVYSTGTTNAATLSVGSKFIANTTRVTIDPTVALFANGGAGSAGQVLTSNGSTVYWSSEVGDISSVVAGNGLTGGGTSGDVTLDVAAGNGISVSADAVAVVANAGLTANSTGLHVVVSGDSTLIANATGLYVNDATLSIATSQLTGDVALGTQTSGNYVATITAGSGISGSATGEGSAPTIAVVANSGIVSNSTGVFVNANSGLVTNSTGVFVNANNGIVANSTGTFARAGNGVSVDAGGVNVLANSGLASNSTGVHVVAGSGIASNSTGVHVVAGSSGGLVSNSTGVFVTAGSGLLTNATGLHVGSGNGITVSTDALQVTGGSTLVVNATGVHVNTGNLTFATSQITSGNYVATLSSGNGVISSATSGTGATPAVYVLANNGIVANTTGVYAAAANGISVTAAGINVTGGDGLVSNASGVHVVAGNGVSVSADAVSLTTGSTLTLNSTGVHVNSALSITDLSLSGNLTVLGTLSTIDTTNITVKDSLIELANGNVTTDILDIGIYGQYGATGAKFTGLFRDATDGVYKLFTASQEEPTTTVNTAATGYSLATLQAYLNSGGLVSNATNIAITGNSTLAVAITANTLSLTTALPTTSGGTGLNSYTTGDLVYASATNTLAKLAANTDGTVLQMNASGLPIWASLDGGTF